MLLRKAAGEPGKRDLRGIQGLDLLQHTITITNTSNRLSTQTVLHRKEDFRGVEGSI